MKNKHLITRPIQLKISALTAAILLIMTLFSVTSSYLFFWNDFQYLEEKEANHNRDRVRNGFFSEIETLHQFVLDWSSRDDSYSFVQSFNEIPNPVFIASNMTKSTFWNANLDSVIFLDKEGDVVWAKEFNSETGKLKAADPRIVKFIQTHKPFSKSGKYGIYVDESRIFIISTRPILNSYGIGPRQGYLAMMQKVDDDFINTFKKDYAVDFSLKIISTKAQQQDLNLQAENNSNGWGQITNSDLRTSFFNVASINGDFTVEFSVYTDRSITEKAMHTLSWNGIALFVSVIITFLILVFSLDRIVVSPLKKMSKTILHMGQEATEDISLNENRKDEIGLIAHEINKMQKRILDLALNDHLTNLPNRRLFEDRMGSALRRAKRENTQVALLFMDLNGFKTVNDTLGHHVGDELLVRVARRLKTIVRASDSLARLGGDEFGLIMELREVETINPIETLCKKIVNALERSFIIENQEINISTSIGISIFPDHALDSTTIIRYADIAMYACKANKEQLWIFYEPDIEKK